MATTEFKWFLDDSALVYKKIEAPDAGITEP